MNNLPLYLIATVILVFSGVCFAQTPNEIAGFVLGKSIEEFKDRLDMSTDLPIRYRESLREVEIKKTKWFKSGLITYGTCTKQGQIVRIKLKYTESSKKFYETLLKRFKKKFGEPKEWRSEKMFSNEDDAMNYYKVNIRPSLQRLMSKIGNDSSNTNVTYNKLE